MLRVENIKKSFGNNVVLENINLNLIDGEIYGLIGSNGAGKTTLFNIIAQVLNYDSGSIFIDDNRITNISDLAHKVGYIIDIPALYDYMTPLEYLTFLFSDSNFTNEQKSEKIDNLLKLVGLIDVKNKRIKSFSRGMKQRMGIAAGLIFEPKLIIMDEPSSALDPQGRLEVLNIIQELKKNGKTIILSTHILNDIERICDRVGLLINGEIKVEGKISDILKKYLTNTIKITPDTNDAENVANLLKEKGYNTTATSNSVEVDFSDVADKKNILKIIINSKYSFDEISVKRQTLEEIFFNINKEMKK